MSGVVTLPGSGYQSKEMQFIFLNRRHVRRHDRLRVGRLASALPLAAQPVAQRAEDLRVARLRQRHRIEVGYLPRGRTDRE